MLPIQRSQKITVENICHAWCEVCWASAVGLARLPAYSVTRTGWPQVALVSDRQCEVGTIWRTAAAKRRCAQGCGGGGRRHQMQPPAQCFAVVILFVLDCM